MAKPKVKKQSVKPFMSLLRILLIVSFCMSIIFFYFYIKSYLNYQKLITAGVERSIPRIINSFNSVFKKLAAEGDQYANEVASMSTDLDSLNAETQNFLKNTMSVGTIIAISPNEIYEFNRNHMHKKINAHLLQQILKRERSGWLTTFKSTLANENVVAYAIHKNHRTIIAMYPVSLLQRLANQLAANQAIIESMDLFDERTTQILVSPIKGARFDKTLIQLAQSSNHPHVVERLKEIVKDRKGGVQFFNRKSGDPVNIIYKNVKHTPWFLSILYKKRPLNEKYIQMQKTSYWLIFCVIPFIVTAMYLLHKKYVNEEWSAWVIALTFSAMSLLFSMYILSNAKNIFYVQSLGHYSPVTTRADLSKTIDIEKLGDIKKYIPTGIQVYHIKVLDNYSAQVMGIVWQTFPKDEKAPTEPDVSFLNKTGRTFYKESYSKIVNNTRVVGWWFQANLYVNLFSKYFPFTYNRIYMAIGPKDVSDGSATLVPMLNAYDKLRPGSLPAINKDFMMSQYDLKKSFFSYNHVFLDFDYGLDALHLKQDRNRLVYNIIVEPHFLPIFMSYLFPSLVILVMLFCYFTLYDTKKDKSNLMTDLVYVSALLLTLALSDTNFIKMVGAIHFTFLQFFFAIGYSAVILVTIFIVLNCIGKLSKQITQDGFIMPRLFFWPILTLVWITVTFFWFYP